MLAAAGRTALVGAGIGLVTATAAGRIMQAMSNRPKNQPWVLRFYCASSHLPGLRLLELQAL